MATKNFVNNVSILRVPMAADPQMQQLAAELSQLTRSIQQLTALNSRMTADSRQSSSTNSSLSSVDLMENIEDFRKSLIEGKTLNKQQQKLVAEAIELKQRELKAQQDYTQAKEHAASVMRSNSSSEAEKQTASNKVASSFATLKSAQDSTKQVTDKLNSSFGALNLTTKVANASLVWFGATLKEQAKQLLAQNKANGGVVEGTNTLAGALLSQQNTAFKFAVTGEELAKISSANRQTFNAMGGTAKALSDLTPTIQYMQISTGSFTDALRITSQAATDFTRKGIVPTANVMEKYTQDIVMLQKRTGMGAEQAMAYFNEIASDTDTIDLLRSARKDEREAILQNQRALIDQSIALGMSAEQAKEAARQMNKMVTAKPLDRIKQAARIRMVGGALGISGANEAADALIAGKRDPNGQAKLADFNTKLANAMDASGRASPGMEITMSKLLEKSGLEDIAGKGSSMSTSLADTNKPAIDLVSNYIVAANTQAGEAARIAAQSLTQLELIVKGQYWGGPALALLGVIAASLAGKTIGSALGSVGKGISGMLTGAGATTGTIAGAVTNGGGKLAAAASTLGSVAKVAGGAVIAVDVGKGLYDLSQGQRKDTFSPTDLLSPMSMGMYAGEKLINQPFEQLTGGSIGSKLYDWLNPDPLNTPKTPVIGSKPTPPMLSDMSKKTSQLNKQIQDTSSKTMEGMTSQLKETTVTNDTLKQLLKLTERQIELSEQQIKIMVPSEYDQANNPVTPTRSFRPSYNYVG